MANAAKRTNETRRERKSLQVKLKRKRSTRRGGKQGWKMVKKQSKISYLRREPPMDNKRETSETNSEEPTGENRAGNETNMNSFEQPREMDTHPEPYECKEDDDIKREHGETDEQTPKKRPVTSGENAITSQGMNAHRSEIQHWIPDEQMNSLMRSALKNRPNPNI